MIGTISLWKNIFWSQYSECVLKHRNNGNCVNWSLVYLLFFQVKLCDSSFGHKSHTQKNVVFHQKKSINVNKRSFARWLAPKNTTMKITAQHKIVWACKAVWIWKAHFMTFPFLNSLHRSFILASSNPNNKAFDQSWQKINYTYHLIWKVIQH